MVYGGTSSEEKSKIFRRSLYISEDMKAGDVFTDENLRIVRPGSGELPKYYDLFIGKKVKHNVKKGLPVTFDIIL